VRSFVQPFALAVLALASACSRARRSEPVDTGAASSGDATVVVEGSVHAGREIAPAEGAFDDSNQLEASPDGGGEDYTRVVASLIRAEVAGTRPGAFLDTFRRAPDKEKERLRYAASDALQDPEMTAWIDPSPELSRAALWLASSITPPDLAAAENVRVEARIAAFSGWDRYIYHLIIVPGYTPLDQREPLPGVHPVARARLEAAAKAYRADLAPFIMVSGGNVYPRGTPYYEGVEMKRALVAMGIPEHDIVLEARARHSTTNLRNAGRFMLTHGLKRALVTPPGGGIAGSRVFDQAFYFANPEHSTFHSRCERELGFRIGELQEAGPDRVAFVPTRDVLRTNYRDPLDP
jgi:hypothetical protein